MGLKQYQIIKEIKSNLCEATFKAESALGIVLIKQLDLKQLAHWKSLDLFLREIETLNNIKIKGVPKLLDYFREDDFLYLVQEWIPGETIALRLQQKELFLDHEIVQLVQDLLTILVELHRKGIIHRDIKPDNVVIGLDGSFYLIDFGAVSTTLQGTSGSTMIGSYGYTPPEQLISEVTPKSDLYALGVTLIAVLTQMEPHEIEMVQLRFQYRQHLFISDLFAHFIDQLIAPMADDRCDDAEGALKLFGNGAMAFEDKKSTILKKELQFGVTVRGDQIMKGLKRVPLYFNLNQNRVKQMLHPNTAIKLLSKSVYENSNEVARVHVRVVAQHLEGWLDLHQSSFINFYNRKKRIIQSGRNHYWFLKTGAKIGGLCGILFWFF